MLTVRKGHRESSRNIVESMSATIDCSGFLQLRSTSAVEWNLASDNTGREAVSIKPLSALRFALPQLAQNGMEKATGESVKPVQVSTRLKPLL
jgi:hypothetical protein